MLRTILSRQDCSPRARKSRRMSEKKRKPGPGRPRIVGRKPSEGKTKLTLRLPPDVEAWLAKQFPDGGRQTYILALIRADMPKGI